MAKLAANGEELARLFFNDTASGKKITLSIRDNGRVMQKVQNIDTLGTARRLRAGIWRRSVSFKGGAVLRRWIDAKLKKGWILETAAGAPGGAYPEGAVYRTLVFNKTSGAWEDRPTAEIEHLIEKGLLAAAGGELERPLPSKIEKGRGPTPRAFGDGRYPAPTTPQPTVDQLMAWEFDGVYESTDGCRVEPDGKCEHGHVSWARYLGVI